MKKMAQFRQILRKEFSRFADFYDKFQYVRNQEYRRILFFFFYFYIYSVAKSG
jgi:hypothetical protein